MTLVHQFSKVGGLELSENLKDTSELGNGTCLANVSLMINPVG